MRLTVSVVLEVPDGTDETMAGATVAAGANMALTEEGFGHRFIDWNVRTPEDD